ncbi:MAG: hypothetical protein NTW54_03450 [Bacteroidetes bacterium]|nr:hypothetical protein [Bacteroidota bacterium]
MGYFEILLKREKNENFKLSSQALLPCITDKTSETPLDYVYFYQNAWAAAKIFEYKPTEHYDIGSQVGFVGILSQFVKTTFLDIRSIDVELPGLHFKSADILKLPFQDNTLESVSSICVIEHIGLGRYGDAINGFGSEEAIAEIIRVTRMNKIYFNAHRAFTPSYLLKLFDRCNLVESKYIYGSKLLSDYDIEKGFGTGLYYFIKK